MSLPERGQAASVSRGMTVSHHQMPMQYVSHKCDSPAQKVTSARTIVHPLGLRKMAFSGIIAWLVRLGLLAVAFWLAYDIRMYAIREYGRLIHGGYLHAGTLGADTFPRTTSPSISYLTWSLAEFDPWFNFHATRYLFEVRRIKCIRGVHDPKIYSPSSHALMYSAAQNGIEKFFKWFDHRSWYPLGRPVGTTIYPGMQLTSVGVWHLLDRLGMGMSLNDICVFVPTWFGGLASVLTGFMAAECSGIPAAAPAAALIMSVIPAHIMRSVGGGYDNESIAVSMPRLSCCHAWSCLAPRLMFLLPQYHPCILLVVLRSPRW